MKCLCGSDLKIVPAGISKNSGKPYNAFVSCSERNCKIKPDPEIAEAMLESLVPETGIPTKELIQNEDTWKKVEAVFKQACYLVAGQVAADVKVEKPMSLALVFFDEAWKHLNQVAKGRNEAVGE